MPDHGLSFLVHVFLVREGYSFARNVLWAGVVLYERMGAIYMGRAEEKLRAATMSLLTLKIIYQSKMCFYR